MSCFSVFGKLTITAAAFTLSALGQGNADLAPNGKGIGTIDHPAAGNAHVAGQVRASGGMGISYHGGPVMTGTINVYYIWYGNWSTDTAVSILTDLALAIGGSPYFNINTTYSNSAGLHVQNSVLYKTYALDNYSHGTRLGDAAVQAIVAHAIGSGKLPLDSNGVYFVLGSPDVKEVSGFCTSYCGWHTRASISGKDIKYAFVGDAAVQCPSACIEQTASPNGNPGADGMASVIAHELEEAATDPDLNAWYDSRGQENADKCAWTFGATYTTANGAKANMKLGARDYLIQRNWVNASGGGCALSY